ncbi:MAG TPA: AsmA-like C-terminal region-containing protein [Nitrobacter sp.]|uniref:AsmA family protein n=1 Tax=Nitrobacter sp. TaxID=29420 RepID=UPI002B7D19EC|nr:AsmA-like C-terminal region-containing protein [Nitrobacter sp.]
MQTTLLGLAITLIVALFAALVGPYFIDWNRFRSQFETEAARVIGAPVRVDGRLDARLLPSPSLRFESVTVGGPNDPGKMRADSLAVEFSLGSLMRGEWRATELTINGVALDLGLNDKGQVDGPLMFSFGSLSVDQLNLTGRVALHDAASRSAFELSDIAFSGEVRSSGASVRGNGNFVLSGTRYPFQISLAQAGSGDARRVHVTIDPGARAEFVDVDGVLSFDERSPRFDGALTLAGAGEPAGKSFSGDPSQRPWRVSARVKADPKGARLDRVEAGYGRADSALRLTGGGEIHFGSSPRLHVALSAPQLDADRLLAGDRDPPARLLRSLQGSLTKIPKPWLAADIGISADRIMLGGRPIQNFETVLHSDAASWTISRLAFQPPGATRVTVKGEILHAGSSSGLNGTLDVESSDPDTFIAWLRGEREVTSRTRKPLHVQTELTVDRGRVVFEQLKADTEGGSIEGRLAFVDPAAENGTRADVELKARRFDLDAAASLISAASALRGGWPDEGRLSLNIDRAISAGQELHPLIAELSYGPTAVALEQLKVGSSGGLQIDGSGAFDRVNTTGRLSLNATSESIAPMAGVIAPFAPGVAARLEALPAAAEAAGLHLTVNIGKSQADKNRADAGATLKVDLPRLKGTISLAAAPSLAAVRAADLDALTRSEMTMRTKLTSERGGGVPMLLGLDRVIAVANPSVLETTATGTWRAPIRLNARMSGADLDAEIKGTAQPWSPDRKADLHLTVHQVDLKPLLNLQPSDPDARKVRLSSHVTLAGSKLVFSDLDSAVAGSRMRGHVTVNLGNENHLEGEIGINTLDVAAAFGLAAGFAGRDPANPWSVGLPEGWRAQLAFAALRGVLPGDVELKPFSGVIKGDEHSLIFDALKGKIGGGDAMASLDVRQTAEGVALNVGIQLTNVEGSSLRYGALAMPAGRTSARITLASQGRSVSAMVGALSGDGVVTLDHARIPGLDPHSFDAAVNSGVERGSDDVRLQEIVERSLSAAPLSVASAQIPFTVRDGRLRVSPTPLDGEGAQAIVSGGYDITADQVDIRAGLVSTSLGSANGRPEVQIFAVGSPHAINRTIDVAALSSWLAVRSIDRETRRLDSIEQSLEQPPVISPAPASPQAEPLEVSDPVLATNVAPVIHAPVPKRDPRRFAARHRMTVPLPFPRPSTAAHASGVSPPPASRLPAETQLIAPAPMRRR